MATDGPVNEAAELDLGAVFEAHEAASARLELLQSHRVHDILLVASLFDAYVLSEGQHLAELIIGTYEHFDLTGPPTIRRVSTPAQALAELESRPYDLLIALPQPAEMLPSAFAATAKAKQPGVPVYVVAYNGRALRAVGDGPTGIPHVDRRFLWRGDARLFLAMIKLAEDWLNVEADAQAGGVRSILLVEDSVPFYSAYLPLLLGEIMRQTSSLIDEQASFAQRLLRRRLRPKLLLAHTYEEAWSVYEGLHDNLLCVIADLEFPRGGVDDPEAGSDLLLRIRDQDDGLPLLVQSSDDRAASVAEAVRASRIDKRSPTLLSDLREFMLQELGFGDFVFRLPDGREVGRAKDVAGMLRLLATIPAEGLVFHGSRHHFSNWLMARTEFRLATALRRLQVSDFASAEDMRRFLEQAMATVQSERRRGQIEDFEPTRFDGRSGFWRIGGGSLGGKGRGLAFMYQLLGQLGDGLPFSQRFVVPQTVVLGTEVFDRFMAENDLWAFALSEADDLAILRRFRAATLPVDVITQLRGYLATVDQPLAVRSSSLAEDSPHLPAAGVYPTHFLPNSDPDLDVRLQQLCAAIQHIYASVYWRSARAYCAETPGRIEDEKMAVVLQPLVGRRHEHYFYPVISGVAASHNYYPLRSMRPEDGVALVALGLGKTIVEGGRAIRFSPAHPRWLPDLSVTADILENSQRQFWALDLSRQPDFDGLTSGANLELLGLEEAERHCTLWPVASVYSVENDAVYDGLARAGVRLVTFAPILKQGVFPLAEALQMLLALGQRSLSGPCEIEFAMDVVPTSRGPSDLAILQVRPQSVPFTAFQAEWRAIPDDAVLVRAGHALGAGQQGDIYDVLAVSRDRFDRSQTAEIAAQVAALNQVLEREGRACVLIGPGRWGTSDPWLGIPVRWSDVSAARVIVETDLADMAVEPSQGSHFFRNLASLGIAYFTVGRASGGSIDWPWLETQPVALETPHVRLYRLPDPLEVLVDAREAIGMVLKRRLASRLY